MGQQVHHCFIRNVPACLGQDWKSGLYGRVTCSPALIRKENTFGSPILRVWFETDKTLLLQSSQGARHCSPSDLKDRSQLSWRPIVSHPDAMIEHGKLRTCQVIGQKPIKLSRSQLVDNSNFIEELKKKLLV